jgi:NhaA family Na+:H+ antiporter
MATDIAFALALLALLGSRVPHAWKIFVVAFAVIDDLGANDLIAEVYTAEINWGYLEAALGTWLALVLLNRPLRVMRLAPYLVGGVVIWVCLLNAGIHASIAGVLLAFAIPFSARADSDRSPSLRLEHSLHKPVAFVILPLFALANTGVIVDAQALDSLMSVNGVGIGLGLVLGKPAGVLLLCLLAVKLGVSALPDGMRWSHVAGAGLLGGIGFTMSIFITNLAFASYPALIDSSKLAVLIASCVAGGAGLLWLRLVSASPESDRDEQTDRR